IRWALANGFVEASDAMAAWKALYEKKSVVIHSQRMNSESGIGPALGQMLRNVIGNEPVRRVIVAGGDTSGAVAPGRGIESLEMVGELARGSPLCRVSAPGSPGDGIEITFKGGQIGRVDFFGQVRNGVSDNG